jgi:hypothetical protein
MLEMFDHKSWRNLERVDQPTAQLIRKMKGDDDLLRDFQISAEANQAEKFDR